MRCARTDGTAPTGWSVNRDDCSDSNATIYPGATEYCDSINQDCDSSNLPRNTCPSGTAEVLSPTSGTHCGPGTNGTSTGQYDLCPTGYVLNGYNVRTDATYVQAIQGYCVPVQIVERSASPPAEYTYTLEIDSTGTAMTTPWQGNSTTGTLSQLRCPNNRYVIGFDTTITSSTYMTSFGFPCGSLTFIRSGDTWVPNVTQTSSVSRVGPGAGTTCSRTCSSGRLMSGVSVRTTSAGGPTGVLQSIYPTCSTIGYVAQ
jgi:hypothetical protein